MCLGWVARFCEVPVGDEASCSMRCVVGWSHCFGVSEVVLDGLDDSTRHTYACDVTRFGGLTLFVLRPDLSMSEHNLHPSRHLPLTAVLQMR